VRKEQEMEVNAKLKEMEDEIKVLKAEIRNVLLDIREVILERTNPLEGQEAAAFRMDLHTTASAMAADAAARESSKVLEAATSEPPTAGALADEDMDEPIAPLPLSDGVSVGGHDAGAAAEEPAEEAPLPKVFRRDPREFNMQAEEKTQPRPEIPTMYRAEVATLSANGSLSAWLHEALQAVGPREVERIITIQRSWGNLPPNINRALAYVQELLGQTGDDDPEPVWLQIMQELDRLAAL